MSESPTTEAITPTERAARFFEEVLPLVVLMRPELFDRAPGSLAVFVDGVGDWTVSFGDSASPDAIVEGGTFEADCVAVFSTPMFASLLDGKMSGTPVVMGDETLLERLGQLLIEPSKGSVSARVGEKLDGSATPTSTNSGSKKVSAARAAAAKIAAQKQNKPS